MSYLADLWRQPQIRLGFRRVLVLGPSRGGSVSLRVGEPLRGVRERAAERRINGSPIVGARVTLCNWTQLGLCVRNLI